MKDRLKSVFVAIGLVALTTVQAQEQRPLTLNEAIDLSIKNSKQLKISRAKVEQASAAVKQAIEKKLPEASVSGAYMRLSNANIDMKSKASNSGGGSGNTGEAPRINQAVYGMLNASMPIYTGGRIRYGIESSKFLAEAEKLDADYQKVDVIENTTEAYVNLFKAKSAVDLYNKNLEEARQRVRVFQNLEQNGLLARNDLLKAELQASNTELALLDAQNDWQLANVNMNLMLGLPQSTILALDSSIINRKFEVQALDDYVQSALKKRKDIEALALRKDAANAGVKAAKGEYYPGIALTGGYIAADIPKLLTITNAVNVGLGISYDIGSLWKTKAKIEGAEAQVRQLQATQELMADNIRLQVNKAYLHWLSSQKKIDVYAKAVEQASENFRIVKNKYDNSLATMNDLLEADVAALQANLNYNFAKADAVVSYNKLLQSAGLLEKTETN